MVAPAFAFFFNISTSIDASFSRIASKSARSLNGNDALNELIALIISRACRDCGHRRNAVLCTTTRFRVSTGGTYERIIR